MARKRPSEWTKAPVRFHPARQRNFSFESKAGSRIYDRQRANGLERYFGAERRLLRVARSLRKAGAHHRSMASRVYGRERRVTFNAQVHWLITRCRDPIKLATLMPHGWLFPASELPDVEPRKLLEQLRAALVRMAVSRASGWAYFVLDVEYIEHLDAFSFHVHGVATRGVARLTRRLRERRKFIWPADSVGAPTRPVQVKRVQRGDEGKVVNYLLKSYFGQRVYRLEDGGYVRTGQRAPIAEPRNSELIAWLSRWTIDDFVLPVNVYFGSDRLYVSGRRGG